MSERRYFGRPGHFIAAESCAFHIHTHVNGWCVSTVGEYRPPQVWEGDNWRARKRTDPIEEVGYDGRTYETMVFPLGADDAPSDWSGVDMRGYTDREEAERGHEETVRRYEAPGRRNEQKATAE